MPYTPQLCAHAIAVSSSPFRRFFNGAARKKGGGGAPERDPIDQARGGAHASPRATAWAGWWQRDADGVWGCADLPPMRGQPGEGLRLAWNGQTLCWARMSPAA
eukprot:gene2944-biopygen12973